MSRSFGARSLTTSPPIFSSPSEMSSRPAIIRSAVDFPQPDGPTRITNSPSRISRSMCLTASKPSGYRLTTSTNSISAIWLFLSSSVSSGRTEIYPREPPVNQLPLHRPGRQPRHDPTLEEEHHHDDRDRDHHRRPRDRPGG